MDIFRYFKKSKLSLDAEIRDRMSINQGTAFEAALLLSYTSIFRSGARLDKLFDFRGSASVELWNMRKQPSASHSISFVTLHGECTFSAIPVLNLRPSQTSH
jgi:hypothetical protein